MKILSEPKSQTKSELNHADLVMQLVKDVPTIPNPIIAYLYLSRAKWNYFKAFAEARRVWK